MIARQNDVFHFLQHALKHATRRKTSIILALQGTPRRYEKISRLDGHGE